MTDRQPQIVFVDAIDCPGIEQRMNRLVPWILHADQRYYSVVFAHHDTPEQLADRITDPDSEIALQNMRLMIADDRIEGGFVAFAGRQLLRRREADVVDLYRKTEPQLRGQLRRRFRDLMPLFAPVAPNDFYLSKFQLYPGMNGPALNQPLVDECIRRARAEGFDRIRVDVDSDDELVVDMCRRNEFAILDRGHAPIAGIEYLNMALPLVS